MLAFLALLFASAVAVAAYIDFLQALASAESSNQASTVNQLGYAGLFQMGEMALQDAGYYRGDSTRGVNDWTGSWSGRDGINSLNDFLSNPQAQVDAITRYHQIIENYISTQGLRQYIGTTVSGVLITESGMVAGAHLVGMGNLRDWLRSGGTYVPRDGNKVPITSYAARFAGYAINATPPTYWGPGGTPTSGYPTAATGASSWLPGPGAANTAYADPAAAFYGTTGRNMAEVRLVAGSILATLLFVWAAWSTFGSYHAWIRRRVSSFWTLQRDAVGLGILLLVVIWLVT
jgi:hypothetical protein